MWHNPACVREAERALDEGKLYAAIKNGKHWLCRRNGATKLWKRDESRIRIPFKYGFKGCSALDEHMALEYFRIANSRAEAEGPQFAAAVRALPDAAADAAH